MFDLSGKTALVTGAASGIGASIAETFAGAGATVFVSDVDESGARAMADRIARRFPQGGHTEPLTLDVRDEAACRRAADGIEESASRLDILVNNAGVGHVGTLLQTEGADLDRLYAVNVRGVFNVTKAFLPGMVARRSGVVINMASIGGLVGIRDRVAYCVSKSAVVALTRCLALDHALDGVRVNCICPGRVETPFVAARLREYPDPDRAYREMSLSQPLGRMGRPDEIAAAALYLASDEASFVTGAAFAIDGGWSAG
jgi:NAD(P)-dependent dehydrogenase (short-subunit alcohol dehydrogenase family)